MNTPSARRSPRSRGRCGPGGLFAIDICDLAYGQARRDAPPAARAHDDWAIIARFSLPAPSRFVRHVTTFVRDGNGSWRRDDETHHNVLTGTARLPAQLSPAGVHATVAPAFGTEQLPTGLRVLTGQRVG